jgi:hypothetical protein
MAVSSSSITLTWQDESTNESGFKVKRKTGTEGTYARIASLLPDTTSYTDSDLAASTTYVYKICAFNDHGSSAYSDEVAVTTLATLFPPSDLTATATGPRAIHLAWLDNSDNETGFTLESITTSATSGFTVVATLAADTTSHDHSTGIIPLQARWYRVKATRTGGIDSDYCSAVSVTPPAPVASQAFRVVNSWGKGFSGEKIADGFYYITYAAFKQYQVFSIFTDDMDAYNPTLLVTFQISHPARGDCYVQIGLGSHASPVQVKTFNTASYYNDDPNAYPSNVMAVDVSEFAPNINAYNLFLAVYDDTPSASTGTITSFALEVYTTYGGAHTTLSADNLPKSTTNSATTYVDLHTAGMVGVAAPPAMAPSARISSLVNAHRMTDAELAEWKRRIGVAEKGRNYNVRVDGMGTGLKPPTEEEWARIQKGAMIIDSLKAPSGALGLPPSVDLGSSPSFPPVGNQASQGSCVAWATGYYIRTFQEALEHGWDLSSVRTIGNWPSYYPDGQLDHIFSPTWIYNQINGGTDGGASFTAAADLVSSLGASTWQTTPYTVLNATSWPSEAAYREAPLYRGRIPGDSEWGIHYYLYVTTDAQVAILKTLLANNIPVCIGVDANRYTALSTDDVWDVGTYAPVEINHANVLVGYND